MQNFDLTGVILTILIAFYLSKKVSMYIRYKKSGKLMLKVKLQKDFLVKLIWIVIAGALLVPVVRLYLNGAAIPPEKIKNAILWLCFITIVAFIENQAPKITEGGINASGKFWVWKDINSCKWEAGNANILSIEAKNTLVLLKYPSILRWRVLPEQKLSINILLKGKMKKTIIGKMKKK